MSHVARILAQLPADDRAVLEGLIYSRAENRALRLRARDDALRALALHQCFAGCASGRALAAAVAVEISRYQATGWRYERDSGPPGDGFRAQLHRILMLSDGWPPGERHLRRVFAGLGRNSARNAPNSVRQ